MESKMFCYQCQEAANNVGCQVIGVCGKKPELATYMDALKNVLKGLALVANNAESEGNDVSNVDIFIMESLFKMITNGNFNEKVFIDVIREGITIRENLKNGINNNLESESTKWVANTAEEYIQFGKQNSVLNGVDKDIVSAREVVLYGIMGMAAYHSHAHKLDHTSEGVFKFTRQALASMLDDSTTLDDYIKMIDDTGKYGVEVMALLDKANNSLGTPEISEVNLSVGSNPGILISGHDLHDIKMLLEQSKDSGVDIYTHSEMLPAHYYPELKKYDNLVGNYGGSWHEQRKEFGPFNGPVLFTTNCIVPPFDNADYNDRIYTTGNSGYPGWKHIPTNEDGTKDFTEIIEHAKKCSPPTELESGKLVGGFAHSQVLALADKVIEAIQSGAIKNFVVMAGCDGRLKSRQYYTDFAKALPEDTIILTAGCAKFRYNKLDLGDIGGIPRVLDAGQCNDSYSLAVIAMELAKVLGIEDLNDLPIAYNIAWYEQKAVIVLLALLHLKVKNMRIGPTLPAFLSENVANFLVNTFNLGTITTVEEDIKALLA